VGRRDIKDAFFGIQYGVLGIWRLWAHLMLLDSIERSYDPVEALTLAFSLNDYDLARSVMEALPLDKVQPPPLWDRRHAERMGFPIFVEIVRTCYESAAEVLQPGLDGKSICLNGTEFAKKFPWEIFFPDADVPEYRHIKLGS
jgi:hypothetical protein